MPRQIKGLLVSRLITVGAAILVPVVIWVLFTLIDFEVAWFPPGDAKNILVRVVTPLIYSVSWLFLILLFKDRISATIDAMDRSAAVIPLRLLFFYGLNALFVLCIFVFPLLTPVLAVLAFASFAWRLATVRKSDWGEQVHVSGFTWFLVVLFAIPPIFCSVMILPETFGLAVTLWNEFWLPIVDLLYDFSLVLCTSLTFGSLIFFVKTGASEYEHGSTDEDLRWVHAVEVIIFLFLLFLLWKEIEFINVFFWVGMGISFLIPAANFLKGRQAVGAINSHPVGYVIAGVFVLANLLWETPSVKNVTLLVTAIVFIVAAIYTFFHLDEDAI